jgi:UDP-N-acetylmuramoyl-tripeptide--D-alanyl-D-alanine ligase
MKRKLSEIARMAGGTVPELFGEVEVCGVAVHPKDVQAGYLFVPLRDESGDGHDTAEEAVRRGAAALLWENGHSAVYPGHVPAVRVENTEHALVQLAREYRKELPVRTMVITGSDGKTTTKDLLAAILATTYRIYQGSTGTANPLVDLACSILHMDETTQMAVFELQWSEKGGLGEQSKLLAPEAAIITNVGEAHLKQLGTRREIAYAKMQVVDGLIPGGLLVYNGEEPLLAEALRLADKLDGVLTYRFGSDDTNDLFPIAMLNEPDGTSFKTNLPTGSYFRIPLLGLHNIMNALAAVAVSKYMGVYDLDVVSGLKNMERNYTRLVPMSTRFGAVILNDSQSASPTSMKAAIELLKDLPGYERKIVVLGDMTDLGPDEIRFHKEVGALLTQPDIYKVFAYGTLAKHIASEASKGLPAGRVRWFQEKAELIDAVAAEAKEKDAILVKGSRMMGLDELVEVLTGV